MRALKAGFIVTIAGCLLSACGEKPAPDPASIAKAAIELPTLPSAPGWANLYLGKPLNELFPNAQKKNCFGNIDGVAQSDDPTKPFASFGGWAWDDKHKAPFDKTLVVNPEGIVIGAGAVETDRPDVIEAAKDRVTNPKVGFAGVMSQLNGSATVYGVNEAAGFRCQIGTEYVF